MQGTAKRYFPGGNTYKGFHSFFEEALAPLNRVFIIKGGPGTGKSTFIKSIGSQMMSIGYDVEYLCCSGDAASIDGVIIPKLGVGIVDGTAPHVIDPKYPGAIDEIVNFGDVWNEQILIDNSSRIMAITKQIKQHYATAYQFLNRAKDIRDSIENFYIRNMKLKDIESIAERLSKAIMKDCKPSNGNKVINRFAAAITHKGIISHMNEMVSDIKTKYILESPSIEVSSMLLAKIEKNIIEKGYSLHRYHDCLKPELTNMLVLPECSILIGSRDYFQPPSAMLEGEVIDISHLIDSNDLVIKEADIIEGKKKHMFQIIESAIAEIGKSKGLHDELEGFYIRAMDFEKLKVIKDRVIEKINSYIE